MTFQGGAADGAVNDWHFMAKMGAAGIPATGPVDEKAANRMLVLMGAPGGSELIGEATELPEGTFLQPGS